MLSINILDENDNSPLFSLPYTSASVLEEESPPVYVTSVKAVDADSGENSRVTYTITSGNDKDDFSIDTLTGIIKTKKRLDREMYDKYTLEITASDHVCRYIFSLSQNTRLI